MCEHCWVSLEEVKNMNLPRCKGDFGPVDTIPMMIPQKDPKENESVCFKCFEIYGQPLGKIESDLEQFANIVLSFKNC